MKEDAIERPFILTWEQKQVLIRARELIADKKHWSEGQGARYLDKNTGTYKACDAFDAEAVKFNAYGALTRAAFERTGNKTVASKLADEIENSIPHPADSRFRISLVDISEKRGHQGILDLFDSVITKKIIRSE